MLHTTTRRALVPMAAASLLLAAAPATAGAQLPGDPTGLLPDPGGLLPDPGGLLPDPGGLLPGDPGGGLPGDPGGGLPGELPGGLTGDLPIDLPGGEPGTGPGGTAPGGETGTPGTPGSALDATAPRIAGPKKAPTVRVDSKRRFRIGGVVVTCPTGCRLSVKVRGAGGVSFVRRTFDLRPGASLQLKKLKVSKKGLRTLRSARVARVVARLKASPPAGASAARDVGIKLKPAKR